MPTPETIPFPQRLIKLPEVLEVTGLGRSSCLAKVKESEFPAPVKIGKRAVAWRLSEVVDWIESLESAQDQAAEG